MSATQMVKFCLLSENTFYITFKAKVKMLQARGEGWGDMSTRKAPAEVTKMHCELP